MVEYLQLLCGIAVILLSLYYYYTSTYDFWKNRGILGPKPTVLFGNLTDIVFKRRSMSECLKQFYDEFKHEQVFGVFEGRTPTLVINDLDLAEDVLIRDFSVFADRGLPYYKEVEPLAEHLFFLESERWKPLRSKLSPVFTSGKLKEMFPLIIECSDHLEEYLDKITEKEEYVECRELAAKFTTDVIGNCVFGIDMNALSNDDSEFRKMGRKFFAPGLRTTLRNSIRQFLPSLYKLIGHKVQPEGVIEFFTKVITDTMRYRKENNIFRPDFIHILMELKEHPEKLQNIELTNTLLTAQAFVFFVAGFETSSSTIAHTLYELAQNQDIQNKLRKEISDSYGKYGKELTYDQVKEMKYLDKVFKETLRKYPILPMLTRVALDNYTFKGTHITIRKGTRVWIPVYPIHWDPDIYTNPDKFDPERFTKEAANTRHPVSYLAFGDGPRLCIGARFANYQAKVGIITVLRNHKVDICDKTVIPYKQDPEAFLLTLQGGVNLKITKI